MMFFFWSCHFIPRLLCPCVLFTLFHDPFVLVSTSFRISSDFFFFFLIFFFFFLVWYDTTSCLFQPFGVLGCASAGNCGVHVEGKVMYHTWHGQSVLLPS